MSTKEATPRELTIRAVVVGLILSVVMGAANVYLGLYAGMTVSASIPAAVLGMLILRGLMRDGTILEANQVQTAASAGESLAAGVIFTLPALVMIGVWKEFDMWMTTAIAFAGGLLGILFMIPLRRVFVVGESEELKFPEGVACATVLKAGDEVGHGESSHAKSIVKGALIGGAFKALIEFVGVIKGRLEGSLFGGDHFMYLGGDLSPALVAVGFIVRLNVAFLVFLGGSIAWLVCLPLLSGGVELDAQTTGAVKDYAYETIRYVGVGAMLVGGAAAIVSVRKSLLDAIKKMRRKIGGNAEAAPAVTERTDTDLSSRTITILSLIAIAVVTGIYYAFTGHVLITIVTAVVMVIMSFFFSAVASYIVGLVGNSNSPVSGMTITAVLFAGAFMLLFGFSGNEAILAILGVAAVVCCVACTSGDVCNDLKTGALVGATPKNQQIMQILGVGVAAFVMAPVMQVLNDNVEGGIGGDKLSAPQAGLFKSLAEAFAGHGQLPWDMIGIGVGIGIALLIADTILKARKAPVRLYVMPVAVGMYLPFGLAPPILLGGILAWLWARRARSAPEAERMLHRGVLFSSGIIAGEALTGVGLAILASAGVEALDLDVGADLVTTLSVAGAALIVALFWLETKPAREE